MKIQINFDSWEELCHFLATASAGGITPAQLQQAVAEAKPSAFEEAQKHVEQLRAEAEQEAEAPAPATEEAPAEAPAVDDQPPFEEAPAPDPAEEVKAYTLADAQRAVRNCVKAKGKDATKVIMANFRDKNDDSKPAVGASTLKPEDYAAAIKMLEEAIQ